MRIILFLPFLFVLSCADTTQESPVESKVEKKESAEINPEKGQALDSGILKDVDPEQIITDDWSDDGNLELEIEE